MTKKQSSKSSETNKIVCEKLPDSEVKLTITVPKNEFEEHIKKTLDKFNKEIKVDGFRAGKIPEDVVERTVGSEKILYEGAELAIKESYVNAILDEKIEAIGEPNIQITKIARGNDFEFTATVGILPKISFKKWEDEVGKVNKKFSGKEIKVEPKEVDTEVKFLANQRAKVVTVSREAKKGDQVEVDFEVSKDRVLIENGTAKKQQIVIGENKFIPGFEQKLIGAKTGEERSFELSFPKEYHAKHLAGKDATFNVKINLVQERQLPKIDDKFASGIGKFKSLQELKKNITEGIKHEAKHKQEEEQKKEIIDAVVGKMELDVPKVLIDREIGTMMIELEQDISKIGLTKEQYFEQIKTTEEKMKQQWAKEQAPLRVKAALALREIAKQNKISPDAKEIEDEVNKVMQYYQSLGQTEEKFDAQRLYEATKGNLTNQKVFHYLMKI